MEVHFPNTVRQVKDEDVEFLLQELGVLKATPTKITI